MKYKKLKNLASLNVRIFMRKITSYFPDCLAILKLKKIHSISIII